MEEWREGVVKAWRCEEEEFWRERGKCGGKEGGMQRGKELNSQITCVTPQISNSERRIQN